MSVKRAGCCTICDAAVFDVKTTYTAPPLAGFPRKLGEPTERAWRVEYALSDGSTTYLTYCDECLASGTAPEMFPDIWAKCLATFAFEMQDDVRAAQPAEPYTERQRSAALADLLRLSSMSIVGVIASQKWRHAREKQEWRQNIA